jgi:hypothetical protein
MGCKNDVSRSNNKIMTQEIPIATLKWCGREGKKNIIYQCIFGTCFDYECK